MSITFNVKGLDEALKAVKEYLELILEGNIFKRFFEKFNFILSD
jgi:hypothetical protein